MCLFRREHAKTTQLRFQILVLYIYYMTANYELWNFLGILYVFTKPAPLLKHGKHNDQKFATSAMS